MPSYWIKVKGGQLRVDRIKETSSEIIKFLKELLSLLRKEKHEK